MIIENVECPLCPKCNSQTLWVKEQNKETLVEVIRYICKECKSFIDKLT